MAPPPSKRRHEGDDSDFRPEWEDEFAFTTTGGRPVCLICGTALSVFKLYNNVKRHYDTHHKTFTSEFPLKSELRGGKLAALKGSMKKQEKMLMSFSKDSDTVAESSFWVSWHIARAKLPYSTGEVIKSAMSDVARMINPNDTRLHRLLAQTPVSRHTTERRISQISAEVACKLHDDLKNSLAFSLALESTDIKDNPQLAVFVRYVLSDFTVKEELLDLITLKETTRGIDLKNALDEALKRSEIPLDQLTSVATDGAPEMVEKHAGLIALLKSDPRFPDFLPVHCIIHCERLVARYFKYEAVMKTVLEIVNFIHSSGKTHRQFRNLIEEMDLEDAPSDISYHCNVRWLSTSNVLNRFLDLLEPIATFLEENNKSYPQLKNDEWMQDLMFLTDIMNHLQTLNLRLQGKEKNISDFTHTVFSFQGKLRAFQTDILSRDFFYFPNLKRRVDTVPNVKIKDQKLKEYSEKIEGLLEHFKDRFVDLQELKPCIAFIVNPFQVDVNKDGCPIPQPLVTSASAVKLEIIDLQEDLYLKSMLEPNVIDFWSKVPPQRYPELKKTSARIISVFTTTYCCESMYSIMKFVKSKHRASLSDQHLTELLHTALTTYMPDFRQLTARMETLRASSSSSSSSR